ncbi:MAG: nucleotide exchange factor GrpE [Leptospirillia bacterium]
MESSSTQNGTPEAEETEAVETVADAETTEESEPDPAELLHQATDRYQRLYAEFENYKKRTVRENEEFRKYANESLLRELLTVLDNLDHAIAHTRDAESGDTEKLLEGVEMIQRQFIEALGKFNVTEIAAQGEPFDPSVHQAVSQVETDEHPEGSVAETFRKGYRYNERVLRPAMVVVAKRPA